MQSALRLGCQAAALGVAILDLARMHERAIVTLQLSDDKNGISKRAEIFFHEALTPIVEKHQGAWQSKSDLNRLDDTMYQRTRQLAASNRQLRQDIIQLENGEAALRKSNRNHAKLLKESLQLQNGLRQLTHKVLAAQEDERKKISRELQEEIAQTLLGINVRLLLLKRESRAIFEIKNGKTFFSPLISKHLDSLKPQSSVRHFNKKDFQLTSREMEVLQLIAEGSGRRQGRLCCLNSYGYSIN